MRTTLRVSLGITQVGKVDVLVQEIAGVGAQGPRRDEPEAEFSGDMT